MVQKNINEETLKSSQAPGRATEVRCDDREHQLLTVLI
jgi:hypothetical protein